MSVNASEFKPNFVIWYRFPAHKKVSAEKKIKYSHGVGDKNSPQAKFDR